VLPFFAAIFLFLASPFYWGLLQPSLWYKSSVKAVSGDPAVPPAAEQLSLKETSRYALIGNHADSHAPNSMPEHSGALSAKGCGALPTDIVPKGRDCPTPCAVPKISSSAAAKCPVSQGLESKGNPRQVISLGNSATRFARYQDPIVTRMPPISRDGLLEMTSKLSASPGMEVCSSVSPTTGLPGCAPAPTNTSKSPGILAPVFSPSPKGCESVVPTLALGNPKGAGSKCLNSAPMTPGGQEFLSLSFALERPIPHSVKGPDSSTSAARLPLYAPGKPLHYQLINFNSSPCIMRGSERRCCLPNVDNEGYLQGVDIHHL